MTSETSVDFRACPLCEATCGLEVSHRNGEVIRIRGDRDDVFSHGFICPKGSTLQQLDSDPDRLLTPMIRRDGKHVPATWDEAFRLIEEGLTRIIEDAGSDAVAVYLGNPNVHSMSGVLYTRAFLKMLRTRSIFSAATVDQMPKHLTSGHMFGHPDLIPVPDIDRTSYLLMLGANPYESNGSLATAPDWPGRLKAIQQRGGKVVVVDPRRTRTAEAADEHVPIRPGTDPLLLMSMVHVLFDEGLVDLGRLEGQVLGVDEMAVAAEDFGPEVVARACGVAADVIRRLTRELAQADSGAVYGRIGTHTAEFGSMASWLVDALNVLTGNLDSPGGAMFPRAAHEQPRAARPFVTGRWASRVRGLPEIRGELPVSAMAEEILEPGDGRVRALITIAGNPILSTPHSDRLETALTSLEFMISVDLYLNETSRHADVVLPGVSPLRRPHYDFAFTQLSVRNIANYSPALFPLPDGTPDEWQVLLRMGAVVAGMGVDTDLDGLDDGIFAAMVGSAAGNPASTIHGRTPEEIFSMTGGGRGPERMLDFLVRTGAYGDRYGERPGGLTLSRLLEAPHGIDLGPLEPRFPADLLTASGKVELAPAALLADVGRLRGAADRTVNGGFLLVGRRDLRSNNSWMHNIDVLVKGRERCKLQIHTDDAARLGVQPEGQVEVSSASGKLTVAVEISDDIMPGVVSLPHGWGHDLEGAALSVASRRPGVNSNRLSPGDMDPISGNAILNAIPVQVVPI